MYTPVALLSHVKRVIGDRTIQVIGRKHKFGEGQLAFPSGTGAMMGIICYISNSRTLKLAANLDLESLYDLVPTRTFTRDHNKHGTGLHTISTELFLQPTKIRTQEVHTKKQLCSQKGEPRLTPQRELVKPLYVHVT